MKEGVAPSDTLKFLQLLPSDNDIALCMVLTRSPLPADSIKNKMKGNFKEQFTIKLAIEQNGW